MLKTNIIYDFDLDQAFCFNGYIVNENHRFPRIEATRYIRQTKNR